MIWFSCFKKLPPHRSDLRGIIVDGQIQAIAPTSHCYGTPSSHRCSSRCSCAVSEIAERHSRPSSSGGVPVKTTLYSILVPSGRRGRLCPKTRAREFRCSGLSLRASRGSIYRLPCSAIIPVPLPGRRVALVSIPVLSRIDVAGRRLPNKALSLTAAGCNRFSAFGSLEAANGSTAIGIRPRTRVH